MNPVVPLLVAPLDGYSLFFLESFVGGRVKLYINIFEYAELWERTLLLVHIEHCAQCVRNEPV